MRFRPLFLLFSLACSGLPAQDIYDLETVREFRLYFAQPNYWTLLRNNYASKTNLEADLKVDGVTYPKVGVRFRGNTSYRSLPPGSEKIGFNIETDWMVPGQDLYGYDHFNLNNGFHDPTFMREVITYQIARRYMSAPKANFVKVYLNDVYWGIYINVQQPNSDMVKEWFRSNDGNRYRGFPNGGTFDDSAYNYLGSVASNYMRGFEFKKGDGVDLMNVITVLTQTPGSRLPTELPKIFSVDQALWYCGLMNGLAHTDSYIGTGKDHMAYVDDVHGRLHMFPFDVNEAIGGAGGSATLSPTYNFQNTRRPVLNRTMAHPAWRARYDAHYRTMLNESLSWAEIGPLVTKYQAMIRADVVADTKKIYTTAQFTSNLTQNVVSGRRLILALRTLIEQREVYLRQQPQLTATEAGMRGLATTPTRPTRADTVTVNVRATGAASVSLFYRVFGPFLETPMFDDGNHNDGAANDGLYGVQIPPQAAGSRVDYYTSATTGAGVVRFLPRTAEFQAPFFTVEHPTGPSDVVINEVLAKNNTVVQDSAGEYEDYVELYNSGTVVASVSGMYLTDRSDNPTKWQIPQGQFIPPGGTLLIWCDEDASQGPLHANFKISSAGETIMLFASDGTTLLAKAEIGPQVADVATGRLFDTQAQPQVTLLAPTPDAVNAPGTAGARPYSALDSLAHTIRMTFSGTPKIGNPVAIQVAQAPANYACLVMVSGSAAAVPFLDGITLLTDAAPLQFIRATDAAGGFRISGTVPNLPGLPGSPFYFQAVSVENGAFVASNALELIFEL